MARAGNNSFLIGFLLGFFGGCFGVVVAFLINSDWGVPAVIGAGVAVGVSMLLFVPFMGVAMVGAASAPPTSPTEVPTINLDGSQPTSTVPWAPILAAVAGGTIAAAGVVGALYLYSQSEAENAPPKPVPPPPPPPGAPGSSTPGGAPDGQESWVTFERDR